MKSYILSLLLLLISLMAFTQDQQANLEKYWRYRDRLRNNFVVVSPDVEIPGVNIPIAEVWLTGPNSELGESRFIGTGDFNTEFNHYISVLATEYALLNLNHEDVRQTISELLYALLAFERLDAYTEMQYRKALNRQETFVDGDINGFFLRGDMSFNFFNQYHDHFFDFNPFYFENIGTNDVAIDRSRIQGRYNFNSGFECGGENNLDIDNGDYHVNLCRVKRDDGECKIAKQDEYKMQVTHGYECMSNDVIINMLFALSLVKKYVDNNVDISNMQLNWMDQSVISIYLAEKGILVGNIVNFKDWADDIAKRMYNVLSSTSLIKNPVTNKLVAKGSGEDHSIQIRLYGFNQAINRFFNGDGSLNGNPMLFDASIGIPWSEQALPSIDWAVFNIDGLISSVITSKINEQDPYLSHVLAVIGNISPTNSDLYTKLRQNQSLGLPLLHMILNGCDNIYDYFEFLSSISSLLNEAPTCGNRSYNPITNDYTTPNERYFTPNWYAWNNSILSNNLYTADNKIESAGLDYMLLHNLFYLAYNTPTPNCKIELATPILFSSNIDISSKTILLKPGFFAKTADLPQDCDLTLDGIYNQNAIVPNNSSQGIVRCFEVSNEQPSILIHPYVQSYNVESFEKITVSQCTDACLSSQKNINIVNTSIAMNQISDFLNFQFINTSVQKSVMNTDSFESSTFNASLNSTYTFSDSILTFVYPNPFNTSINVNCEGISDLVIEISNSIGSVIFKNRMLDSNMTIDVSGWPSGVYILRIIFGERFTVNKLIKQ